MNRDYDISNIKPLSMLTAQSRIYQHAVPPCTVKIQRFRQDRWSDIPAHQKTGIQPCPCCGLPTMRIVYQEEEAYTAICMACGQASRFRADGEERAKKSFNAVSPELYAKMRHCAGLDYASKPFRNEYDAAEADMVLFRTVPHLMACSQLNPHEYSLTRLAFLFLGFDFSTEDWKAHNIRRAKKILW